MNIYETSLENPNNPPPQTGLEIYQTHQRPNFLRALIKYPTFNRTKKLGVDQETNL